MAMPPGRPRPLHNFSLPYLKWGNQRFLRCIKMDSHDRRSRPSIPRRSVSPAQPISKLNNDDDGIEAVREKLMLDLRVAVGKMKVSIASEDDSTARPWNLRTRRAACKAPLTKRNCNSSPMRNNGSEKNERKERKKFSVSISKEEIEEDFLKMIGTRPPRRPKKRPKIVLKQLDPLFPGLWLTEVTPDSYKVDDIPDSGKG